MVCLRRLRTSLIGVTTSLIVFFLFMNMVFGPVAVHAAPRCTLVFCALNGARATCEAPNSSCTDGKKCPGSTKEPLACAIWALGPPALNCAHRCPRKCLHPNHRPVASDGIAYCTDCSFIHASCESAFSIVGPIARGVKYALRTEAPQRTGPSLPSMLPEMTAELEDESVSPQVSNGFYQMEFDKDRMGPDSSLIPSPSSLAVPEGDEEREEAEEEEEEEEEEVEEDEEENGDEEAEEEAEDSMPFPSLQVYATPSAGKENYPYPLMSPDHSEEPSSTEYPTPSVGKENYPYPLMSPDHSEEPSSTEYAAPMDNDDNTAVATGDVDDMYPDYCLAPSDASLRERCCVEYGIGCASRGHACSPPMSGGNQNTVRAMPDPPCERGVTCVLTTVGRPSSGVCVVEVRAPQCAVEQCAMHGKSFVCRLPDSNYVSTCAAWAERTDGGAVPNCNRTCPSKCQSPRLRASNGATFCTTCSLVAESCRRRFAIWEYFQPSLHSISL